MPDPKIEHIKDMPMLKKKIISDLWNVAKDATGANWRKYRKEFTFEGRDYVFNCQYKIESIKEKPHLSYRNFHIEQKQIVIDVEDVLQGKVNVS